MFVLVPLSMGQIRQAVQEVWEVLRTATREQRASHTYETELSWLSLLKSPLLASMLSLTTASGVAHECRMADLLSQAISVTLSATQVWTSVTSWATPQVVWGVQ